MTHNHRRTLVERLKASRLGRLIRARPRRQLREANRRYAEILREEEAGQ